MRYHFLRDLCKDGVIDIIHCSSENQIADIMTKPLKTCVCEPSKFAWGMFNEGICFTGWKQEQTFSKLMSEEYSVYGRVLRIIIYFE